MLWRYSKAAWPLWPGISFLLSPCSMMPCPALCGPKGRLLAVQAGSSCWRWHNQTTESLYSHTLIDESMYFCISHFCAWLAQLCLAKTQRKGKFSFPETGIWRLVCLVSSTDVVIFLCYECTIFMMMMAIVSHGSLCAMPWRSFFN